MNSSRAFSAILLVTFVLLPAAAIADSPVAAPIEPGGVGIRDEAVLDMARQAGATAIEAEEPEIGIGHFRVQFGSRSLMLTNDRVDGLMQWRFSWRTQRAVGEDDRLWINMWNQEPDVGRASLLELPLQGEVITIWVLEDEFEFHPDVPRSAPVDFIRRFAYLAERFDGYVKGDNEVVPSLDDKPGTPIPIRGAGLELPQDKVPNDQQQVVSGIGVERDGEGRSPIRIRSELDQPLSSVAASMGASLAEIGARLGDRNLLYQSIELLEQAVERNPDDLKLATQLADACAATGNDLALAQAVSIYQSQLTDHPDSPQLLARLADVYHQLGNTEDALAYATRRARLAGTANRYGGSLQVTLIATEAERAFDGLSILKSILKENPEDDSVALLTATLLFAADQPEEARELLKSLMDELPNNHPASVAARRMLSRRLGRLEG